MNEFNTRIIKIVFIILGISLFLFALAINYSLNNEKYPKHSLLCPDYWKRVDIPETNPIINDISSTCVPMNYTTYNNSIANPNINNYNYPDNNLCIPGATGQDTINREFANLDISLNSNGPNGKRNLKYKNTINEDQEKLCMQYEWTKNCGVFWDGVSNAKNPCKLI